MHVSVSVGFTLTSSTVACSSSAAVSYCTACIASGLVVFLAGTLSTGYDLSVKMS